MSLPAIVINALNVRFGTFQVLKDLSLVIEYGKIHAVIGPNGAGKTTLLDTISGITRASGGSIALNGQTELSGQSEVAIARAGIRRKFQKPSVFDALTVMEHVEIGAGKPAGHSTEPPQQRQARLQSILETIGLSGAQGRLAGELAHGQKQWLEIGMVLAAEPRVLMLDEPVAGLTDEETKRTAKLLQRLRHPNRAIVVVEHDMDFVEQIADHVSVLHEGQTLFEGSMQAARLNPHVIDVYLGR